MPTDAKPPETAAYLQAQYVALRHAVAADDDDDVIRVVDHIRAEVDQHSAQAVVTALLQWARNPVTDAVSAACIETAMQRYQARYGSVAPGQ